MLSGALLVWMALGPVAAADDEPKPQDPPAAGEVAAPDTLTGEVVLVDTDARVLRIKRAPTDDVASELSLVMEGEAVGAAADLKAGDPVSVTCREGTRGETCVVTGIEKTTP